MAGRRLQSEWRDLSNVAYKIIIYDTESSENVDTEFEIVNNTILLTDEGDEQDFFKRVIPKRFEFTMMLNSVNYTNEIKDALSLFYYDLSSSYEGRFYIRVYHNEVGGATLFRGKILADIGDFVLNFHQDVKVTAIDGITQLKNIEFRPLDYTDLVALEAIRTYNFIDLFKQILIKNDVVKFFYIDTGLAGYGTVFTTSANWTESHSIAGDIFDQVRKRNSYFTQISNSYRKYQNCFDVLTDLLTGFNARIIYSDGVYHIEQLGYQDHPTLTRYGYNADGDYTGSYGNKTTWSITSDDDIKVLAFPSIKKLAPLKAIELKQAQQFTNYMNGMDISFPDNPGPHDFNYVIGTGSNLVFDFRINLDIDPGFTLGLYFIEFEFQIKIGDYYLKSLSTKPNNVDVVTKSNTSGIFAPLLKYEWTLVDTTFKIWFNPNEDILNQFYNFRNWSIRAESLEIIEEGVMTLELLGFKVVDPTGALVSGQTIFLNSFALIKQSRLIIAPNGIQGLEEVPENLSIYEIGDVRNSLIYDINLSYFDSPSLRFNQLFIQNDVYVTNPELTTEWTDSDMGDTLPIQKLVMKQMLSMRALPTEVYNCTLIRLDNTLMQFDDRYEIGEVTYLPIKQIHNLNAGTYHLLLWKIQRNYSGIVTIDTGEPDTPTGPYPDPGVITDTERGDRIIATYFEDWDGITTNNVTTSEPLGFYITGSVEFAEIKKTWQITVNGVVQRYIDKNALTFPLSPGDLQPGQYSFDVDNDKIYFAFDLDSTDYITAKLLKT